LEYGNDGWKNKWDLHFGHGGSSDLYENIFVIFPEKRK